MDLINPLADLLEEEQLAATMAVQARNALEGARDATVPDALAAFQQYLETDLELHLAHEESDIFPTLDARGFAAEVAEATRQHAELRRLRAELASELKQELPRARALVATVADALERHVRWEADFMYVDLMNEEVASFRDKLDADLGGVP